jgi:hypothetical protein
MWHLDIYAYSKKWLQNKAEKETRKVQTDELKEQSLEPKQHIQHKESLHTNKLNETSSLAAILDPWQGCAAAKQWLKSAFGKLSKNQPR